MSEVWERCPNLGHHHIYVCFYSQRQDKGAQPEKNLSMVQKKVSGFGFKGEQEKSLGIWVELLTSPVG